MNALVKNVYKNEEIVQFSEGIRMQSARHL